MDFLCKGMDTSSNISVEEGFMCTSTGFTGDRWNNIFRTAQQIQGNTTDKRDVNLNFSFGFEKRKISALSLLQSIQMEASKTELSTRDFIQIKTGLEKLEGILKNSILKEEVSHTLEVCNEKIAKVAEKSIKSEPINSQAFVDKEKDVSPEAFLDLGRDLINSYQSSPNSLTLLTTAHQRWEKAAEIYEKSGDFNQAFEIRSKILTEMKMPTTHPLYDLESKVDEYVENAQISQDDGAKFNHLDSGVLKRGILSIRKRTFEGEEKLIANFHIAHFAKEKLMQTAHSISQHLEEFTKKLPDHLKSKIIIREVDNGYYGKKDDTYSRNLANGFALGKAIEIEFESIGTIRIAKDNQYHSMRNRITVEIHKGNSPGESLERLRGITTMLGLGPILGVESDEEDERKKLSLLFRTFYPQQAFQLENTQQYYEVSIDSLKQSIVSIQPEMKNIFDFYLSSEERMQKVEIAPGISVWSVPNLDDLMRDEGAIGLMSGCIADPEVLVSILTQGSLCSQERCEKGHLFVGTSIGQDHTHGGAGFVFSRLINEKMVSTLQKQYIEASDTIENRPSSFVPRYPFSGEYQLLYDLSAVNTGAFAYNTDRYGSKNPEHYGKRDNLIDFTKSLNQDSITNEVMIKDRIPPNKIHKILISSEGKKRLLIQSLKEKNLIIERGEKLYIKGLEMKSLDELFVVGRYLTKDMWTS